MNYINKGETKNLPVKDQYVENFTMSERLDPWLEKIRITEYNNIWGNDLICASNIWYDTRIN